MTFSWRALWCWLTFRHRGDIDHDDVGVFWQCRNCQTRTYATTWTEKEP